jgi:CRISPR/Cas system-associated exonuclease Cas4 (RecB family)
MAEKHIWASALGNCPYKTWLRLQGVQGTPSPPEQNWWLEVGKGMEEDIIRQLSEEHPDILAIHSPQEYVKIQLYKDYYATGRVDAIADMKDGTQRIVEIKTMGRRRYEMFLKEGIKAVKYYYPQIQLYMHVLKIPKALLVARDRDSFMEMYTQYAPEVNLNGGKWRIHWVEVDYNEEYITNLLHQWHEWLMTAEFDPESIKKPSGLCRFCEYYDICKPPIPKNSKPKDMDDAFIYLEPEFDAKFDEYQKLRKWFQYIADKYEVGQHLETDYYIYEVRERDGQKYIVRLDI